MQGRLGLHARAISASRMLLGWDQEKLAFNANVSAGTISNIERGAFCKADTVNRILKTLRDSGVSIAYKEGLLHLSVAVEVPESVL